MINGVDDLEKEGSFTEQNEALDASMHACLMQHFPSPDRRMRCGGKKSGRLLITHLVTSINGILSTRIVFPKAEVRQACHRFVSAC